MYPCTIRAVNWKIQNRMYLDARKSTQRNSFTNDNHAVQPLARTKSSLRDTEGQDVTHIRTLPSGMLFQLPLLSHDGLKLLLGWLHHRPLDPAFLQKPIKKLPKQVKFKIFIPADDNFRTETTKTMTNKGTRDNSWEHNPAKVFQTYTKVFTKLWLEIVPADLLKCYLDASAFKAKLLFNEGNDEWLGSI